MTLDKQTLLEALNNLDPMCDSIPLFIGGSAFHGFAVRDLKAALQTFPNISHI